MEIQNYSHTKLLFVQYYSCFIEIKLYLCTIIHIIFYSRNDNNKTSYDKQ